MHCNIWDVKPGFQIELTYLSEWCISISMYFNPLRDHCVVVETINKPFGSEEFYHLYRRFLAVHFVIVVIASESSTVGSLLKVQLSSVINNHQNI